MMQPIFYYGSALVAGFLIPYFLSAPIAISIFILIWGVATTMWITTKENLTFFFGVMAVVWAVTFSAIFTVTILIIYNPQFDLSWLFR